MKKHQKNTRRILAVIMAAAMTFGSVHTFGGDVQELPAPVEKVTEAPAAPEVPAAENTENITLPADTAAPADSAADNTAAAETTAAPESTPAAAPAEAEAVPEVQSAPADGAAGQAQETAAADPAAETDAETDDSTEAPEDTETVPADTEQNSDAAVTDTEEETPGPEAADEAEPAEEADETADDDVSEPETDDPALLNAKDAVTYRAGVFWEADSALGDYGHVYSVMEYCPDVTIELYANGKKIREQVVSAYQGQEYCTFSGLPRTDDSGKAISYSSKQILSGDYGTQKAASQYAAEYVNTIKSKKVSISTVFEDLTEEEQAQITSYNATLSDAVSGFKAGPSIGPSSIPYVAVQTTGDNEGVLPVIVPAVLDGRASSYSLLIQDVSSLPDGVSYYVTGDDTNGFTVHFAKQEAAGHDYVLEFIKYPGSDTPMPDTDVTLTFINPENPDAEPLTRIVNNACNWRTTITEEEYELYTYPQEVGKFNSPLREEYVNETIISYIDSSFYNEMSLKVKVEYSAMYQPIDAPLTVTVSHGDQSASLILTDAEIVPLNDSTDYSGESFASVFTAVMPDFKVPQDAGLTVEDNVSVSVRPDANYNVSDTRFDSNDQLYIRLDPKEIEVPLTVKWEGEKPEHTSGDTQVFLDGVPNYSPDYFSLWITPGEDLTAENPGTNSDNILACLPEISPYANYRVDAPIVDGYQPPVTTGDVKTGFTVTYTPVEKETVYVHIHKSWGEGYLGPVIVGPIAEASGDALSDASALKAAAGDGDGNQSSIWDHAPITCVVEGETLTEDNVPSGNYVTLATVTLSKDSRWEATVSFTYKELIEKNIGPIRVRENPVPGYTLTQNMQDWYDDVLDVWLTNERDNLREVPVTIIWDDLDNTFNTRPESILILWVENALHIMPTDPDSAQHELTVGSENTQKTVFRFIGKPLPIPKSDASDLKAAPDPSEDEDEFGTLPVFDSNGVRINTYDVAQIMKYSDSASDLSTDYEVTVSGNVVDGYTIVNKLAAKNIAITKTWDDGNNAEEIRPESITFNIFQQIGDGEKTQFDTLTLKGDMEAKTWTGSYEKPLLGSKQGKEITYTVEEILPDGLGYTKGEVTGDDVSGFAITNHHYSEGNVDPDEDETDAPETEEKDPDPVPPQPQPDTEKPAGVKTGDDTPIGRTLSVMAIALIGAMCAGIVLTRRRRRA